MAHLKSFQISGAVSILRHNERTENDTVKQRKNECIRPEKTHLNYNLAPKRDMPLAEHIKKVCSDNNIRLNKRKDLNVMSSWVITQPKDVKAEETEKFFADTYNFLSERYGKENILSACVHLDETTPHIHFGFIPVGTDKKGCKTVSSKLVCTRTELKSFHKDLSKYLKQSFGRKISIENGATSAGNKTVEQLKAENELKKIKKEIYKQKKELKSLLEIKEPLLKEKKYFKIDSSIAEKVCEKLNLLDISYNKKKKDDYIIIRASQSYEKAIQNIISIFNRNNNKSR